MQKIALIIGGVLILGLLAFGVNYLLLPSAGKALDDEGKRYIDSVLPGILGTWDEAAYRAALDEQPEPVKQQRVQQFAANKVLGPMVKYNESVGYGTVNGRKVMGQYAAKVTFERGEAVVSVIASRKSGSWKIVMLNVASPALMPAVPVDATAAPAPEQQPVPEVAPAAPEPTLTNPNAR